MGYQPSRFENVFLDPRPSFWFIAVCGREKTERRINDVCPTKRLGEYLGYGQRERIGIWNRQMGRCDTSGFGYVYGNGKKEFPKKRKNQNADFVFYYHRARIRMIPNIFRDWLGGFYINSLGPISGSTLNTLVVGEDKKLTQTNIRGKQL